MTKTEKQIILSHYYSVVRSHAYYEYLSTDTLGKVEMKRRKDHFENLLVALKLYDDDARAEEERKIYELYQRASKEYYESHKDMSPNI